MSIVRVDFPSNAPPWFSLSWHLGFEDHGEAKAMLLADEYLLPMADRLPRGTTWKIVKQTNV